MVIAREAASRFKHPSLEEHRGGYYLGATAPDIRLLTKVAREETHFSVLTQEEQTGVRAFFEAQPHLARAPQLRGQVGAFVAGYLSHLATDDVWIRHIYRPFFGARSPMAQEPLANVLDRILQYELDRRVRQDRDVMAEIQGQVIDCDPDLSLGFLDNASLREWRGFVLRALMRRPSWEGFDSYVQRFLLQEGKLSEEQVKVLVAAPVSLAERALNYVSRQRLEEFREGAIAATVQAAQEYLS